MSLPHEIIYKIGMYLDVDTLLSLYRAVINDDPMLIMIYDKISSTRKYRHQLFGCNPFDSTSDSDRASDSDSSSSDDSLKSSHICSSSCGSRTSSFGICSICDGGVGSSHTDDECDECEHLIHYSCKRPSLNYSRYSHERTSVCSCGKKYN